MPLMLTWLMTAALAGPIPQGTTQLVLVVVPDPESSHATLQRFSRRGSSWQRVGAPLPARVGASGVAWGVGLHPAQPGLQKVEGDLRSPEGLFRLGAGYRDDTVQPLAVDWPISLIGPRDLFVEDPSSPYYNQHLVVPGDRPLLPWEEAARMRLGDPSLALKVLIEHNPPPAAPYAGSAIFLHSGELEEMATAGCTALTRQDLEVVIAWLEPDAQPVFALLTREHLGSLARPWNLPPL